MKNLLPLIFLLIVFVGSYFLVSKVEASNIISVIVGVSIFVVGQFILKLILDPVVSFKEKLGELSALFLEHQAEITSANSSMEVQSKIKKASSAILSKKQAVLFYDFVASILGLPEPKEVLEGCRSLNFIGYKICQGHTGSETNVKNQIIIKEEMTKINKNLRIVVNYSNEKE